MPFRGLAWRDIWGLFYYAPENIREVLILKSDSFDRKFGTDTIKPVAVSDLGAIGEHTADAVFYWPTDSSAFRPMMMAVEKHIRGSTFIDIGCGKGRPLFLAAEYPFSSIIGVEFSRALCEVAERNVQIMQKVDSKYSNIKVDCADITSWTFPQTPLVIYLFDPFGANVMQKFISNLTESLRRSPRTCFVIYRSPTHQSAFENSDFKLIHRQARSLSCQHAWNIYSLKESALEPA